MIGDIKPIPDIFPVPVNRQWLAIKGIEDHQGNQFLGELVRTVVVGTVGDRDRQTIGFVIGSHQMIGRRFGSGIRAVRLIGGFFNEISIRP